MTYKPTGEDIAFARVVVEMVKEGGVWGLPSSGLVYRFQHSVKVLELVNPVELDTPDHKDLHERTREVWRAIGWEVVP